MIQQNENVFRLTTEHTSYWFEITKFGHLEHLYYGPRLSGGSADSVRLKRTAFIGSSVAYDESDELYCPDQMCLEWSGIGRGDYRQTPIEVKMPDGSFVTDFIYQSFEIINGNVGMETLPGSYGEETDCETLKIILKDTTFEVYLTLYYTVYNRCDVITRRAVIENREENISLRNMQSMMLDLPNRGYEMCTFNGGWAREAHLNRQKIGPGIYVNSSTTGGSSNRHNPGFLLCEEAANNEYGMVYGFNLIYSGNHCGTVEQTAHDLTRITLGINPHCFEWEIKEGEMFETPEAVMTCSNKGFNGVSGQFHEFVNEHIVRGMWKKKERPVLFNNWEACFFKFNERKLLHLAKEAKQMGAELFVLDDGWFGERDSDKAGLGDYWINRKKFPRGLKAFADKIRGMGMDFGLWFEPEMVNMDSDLYRAHPEYAVKLPGKKPVLGRNQLVLDLCNPEVQDYIIENVGKVLDDAGVSYVKWDMNRHIAEAYSPVLFNQGEFYHRYIMGLYRVMREIFGKRPHILVETCSSGGNRFDLGMLCYSQQIWASDDTDPIERLDIQGGLSYLYPISTMGAHVSMAPHQQTLRNTPLSTRFNVSCFGCLGYELDLKYLTPKEKEEIKNQIAFYKKYRSLFQFGTFSRGEQAKENKTMWQCVSPDGEQAALGFFQGQQHAVEGYDYIKVSGLEKDALYQIQTKDQFLYINRFGGLMKHVLPVELDPNGFILRTANRHYTLKDCVESYEADGAMLENGVLLNNQFVGSYYNEQTRLLGDFGSSLYVIEKKERVRGIQDETKGQQE